MDRPSAGFVVARRVRSVLRLRVITTFSEWLIRALQNVLLLLEGLLSVGQRSSRLGHEFLRLNSLNVRRRTWEGRSGLNEIVFFLKLIPEREGGYGKSDVMRFIESPPFICKLRDIRYSFDSSPSDIPFKETRTLTYKVTISECRIAE